MSVTVNGSGRRRPIAHLGLTSNVNGKPNDSYEVLLVMARGLQVKPEVKKHTVTKLTKSLREFFGLSGCPFHIEERRGYVPKFQLIDGLVPANRRAEHKAVMVSHQKIKEDRKEMEEGVYHSPSTGSD